MSKMSDNDELQILYKLLVNERIKLIATESHVRELEKQVEEWKSFYDGALAKVWHAGCPDQIYGSEWFIAQLDNGEKVVLRQLPEEFSYDYKTQDETYYMAFRIKAWMQFPDSNFINFKPIAAAMAQKTGGLRSEYPLA